MNRFAPGCCGCPPDATTPPDPPTGTVYACPSDPIGLPTRLFATVITDGCFGYFLPAGIVIPLTHRGPNLTGSGYSLTAEYWVGKIGYVPPNCPACLYFHLGVECNNPPAGVEKGWHLHAFISPSNVPGDLSYGSCPGQRTFPGVAVVEGFKRPLDAVMSGNNPYGWPYPAKSGLGYDGFVCCGFQPGTVWVQITE